MKKNGMHYAKTICWQHIDLKEKFKSSGNNYEYLDNIDQFRSLCIVAVISIIFFAVPITIKAGIFISDASGLPSANL